MSNYVSFYAATKLSRFSKNFTSDIFYYIGRDKFLYGKVVDSNNFQPNELVKAPTIKDVWEYFYRQCGIHIYTNEVDGGYKVGIDSSDGIRVHQHFIVDVFVDKNDAISAAIDYALRTKRFY